MKFNIFGRLCDQRLLPRSVERDIVAGADAVRRGAGRTWEGHAICGALYAQNPDVSLMLAEFDHDIVLVVRHVLLLAEADIGDDAFLQPRVDVTIAALETANVEDPPAGRQKSDIRCRRRPKGRVLSARVDMNSRRSVG